MSTKMKQRCQWHDYNGKGVYLITLVVTGRRPLLGRLEGSLDTASGHNDAPRVVLSPLGCNILYSQFPKISQLYPMASIWKVMIMPDHIHFIISVSSPLPGGKDLGTIVQGFKYGCTVALHNHFSCLGDTLFEAGYNDKILNRPRQIDNWRKYLADNPRRLLVKRAFPDLFTVMRDHSIFGQQCSIVGNHFLLDVPHKMAVIVHRRYSSEEVASLRRQWLDCAMNGGVLVSAAIAPAEKAVLRAAMDLGGRIILLRENGFPQLYKPAGRSFDYCTRGLLLEISPWEYHTRHSTITREQCLFLNKMAEEIAGP